MSATARPAETPERNVFNRITTQARYHDSRSRATQFGEQFHAGSRVKSTEIAEPTTVGLRNLSALGVTIRLTAGMTSGGAEFTFC